MRGSSRFAVALIWLALLASAAGTALGLLAPWFPPLEMVNHFRPFFLLVTVGLIVAALLARSRTLIAATCALAVTTVGLFGAPLVHAAATDGSGKPFLRLVTYNLYWDNPHYDRIADFLLASDADAVLLQEVNCRRSAQLIGRLSIAYRHVLGVPGPCFGQALFSKEPWTAKGRLADAAGNTLALWARFQRGGMDFELGSVHLAFPLRPAQQAEHIDTLIADLATRPGPRIIAGDFNLTPFSWKLNKLSHAAGLRRHATFLTSWSTEWLMPAFLIDNVLSTPDFASAGIRVGPHLGSDHRPLVADVALVAK